MVQDLVKNFRTIMAPNTAAHLVERRTNSVKDYINVAGPYGVTHIILFTKMRTLPRMRIGCFPQGPTLHFRVEEYTLTRDLLKTTSKGIDTISPYFHSPILNMFPVIDPEKIDVKNCRRVLLLQYDKASNSIFLRHYSISRSLVGVGKAINSIVKKKVIPDLSKMTDISEYD
ncbi:hypothetical protein JH06_5758 [Blastocystis sp. subtype 4]|uniref:hypothetical protein n=1 Tax=Blastocystis sp. subtype 4 TaxID=944170 RepID=UPI000711B226|nr:hypothetical protein JH06_5758 [Blastocystis sp. subtype 4]KNB41355.1 hypothetical protein JH06_5758 [Blastocystis sp. subtype 4]|eukprot:XP_014524798.1 hypothetical protein JH06_5758 [Blastocystis sp. subtype 4]